MSDDDRIDLTCLECGCDWSASGDEPEFPLCSNTCLRHFLNTEHIVYNQSFREAIERWGTDHGYCLLESEVDALCASLQPFCQLLRYGHQADYIEPTTGQANEQ